MRVGRPSTATIRSPAWRPALAAGVPASTAATSAVGRWGWEGPPLTAKTTKRIANAMKTFASGPAAMTATRFHVGARQYASRAVPSSTSRSARCADRLAPGERCAAPTSRSSSGYARRAASKSSTSRARRTAPTGAARLGCSRTAGSTNTCRSRAAGRCMPGIRTRPPSGIMPIPYSMPLRRTLTRAGGNPT